MFRQTQNRLTLLYSGILVLFLTVFVAIVYGMLYYIIMNDQKRELHGLVDQELRLVESLLRQSRSPNLRLPESQEMLGGAEDHLFTYMIGPNGQLISSADNGKWMENLLLDSLRNWTPDENETRLLSIQVPKEMPEGRRAPRGYRKPMDLENTQELRILTAGRTIKLGETTVGTVYVGKNISYHYELVNWILFVLCGLAMLFFVIALYISHRMSLKAMAPVKQSYRRQHEFVADASHELRTPLSVLLSSIDSLEMEQTEDRDPFERKLLANMKDEVKRMSRLVGDLLTLARSDTPEYKFQREIFDFEPQARQITEGMRQVAESKQIRLEYRTSGALPVTGDLERLKQLLYILLDNALKYTPQGGEVQVSLSLNEAPSNGNLTIIVKDTGIGIAEEDQTRIFDRFYRADKSRSRQMGGHGLGLSIALWIAEAHHGTIRVDSKPGEGSCFTVKLPVTP